MSYYPTGKHPCEYARGYYMILPNGTLWFRPDTPQDIKERFEKDYAEHLERKRKEEEQGIFTDTW